MSDVAVSVNDLGKKYRIRHQRRERYVALRDVITDGFRNVLRGKADDGAAPATEDFWALKDVSFEVKRGEVIGIIGRNGAGKSTLLKVISRITEPNAGRIELTGRVASMLEVGTGFHPELTGRENIYLNGAILGMRRAEIKRRFDEIVAFAEVENFLDTPVKRFSSGMYVRLAFAVAAHLETEILIVDEVLAVGDAEFQKRCLGKMSQVAQGGRTVLFVSHNMGSIRRLTQRCILLDHGKVMVDAAVENRNRQLPQASGRRNFRRHLSAQCAAPDGPAVLRQSGDDPHANRRAIRPPSSIAITRSRSASTIRRRGRCRVSTAICNCSGSTAPWFTRATATTPESIRSTGCRPDPAPHGSTIPERILGAGTYQIYLSFASGFDPAGPEIDAPGVVGEFRLDDTSTRRGNRRNGFLSLKLPWQMVEQQQ